MSDGKVYKSIKIHGGRTPFDVEIQVGEYFLSGVKNVRFDLMPGSNPNEINVTFYIDKFSFDLGYKPEEN